MDEFTGMQLLETLKDPPYIILTTFFDEYALKAYELDVMDYLLKPIPFERFGKAVDKLYARFLRDSSHKNKHVITESATVKEPEKPDYTFIKSGNKTIKMYFNKILWRSWFPGSDSSSNFSIF